MLKGQTALDAKVIARNKANAYMLEILPQILKALQPFVGQKILNLGAVLSQKVRNALPEFIDDPDLLVFYCPTRYGLRVEVKASARCPDRSGQYHSCVYQEASAHLGSIEDHTLKDLTTEHHFRTDYSTEEIRLARERFEELDKAKRDAEAALESFGQYDN